MAIEYEKELVQKMEVQTQKDIVLLKIDANCFSSNDKWLDGQVRHHLCAAEHKLTRIEKRIRKTQRALRLAYTVWQWSGTVNYSLICIVLSRCVILCSGASIDMHFGLLHICKDAFFIFISLPPTQCNACCLGGLGVLGDDNVSPFLSPFTASVQPSPIALTMSL
jgi:hypothetical protein